MGNQTQPTDDPLPALWDTLAKTRAPWFSTTMLGLSDRTPSNRLRRLLGAKSGQAVVDAANRLDDAGLAQLETVAKVNAEQAEAAFRRTFVFNISAPIGIATAAAQTFPEAAREFLGELRPAEPSFYVFWGSVLGILATVYYAHAKARGARDLADVVTLVHAARARTQADR